MTDEEEWQEYERWLGAYSFQRIEVRKRRLKTQLDCGHWIDGSEPYRYMVWRTNGMPRGRVEQHTDCEFCARRDLVS